MSLPSTEVIAMWFSSTLWQAAPVELPQAITALVRLSPGTVTITLPVSRTRLAMVATLQQAVEVGDHILHICQVDKFLGDESKQGLYAWNGFGKVAPAVEG